jgi:hypothetical protein
LPLDWLPMTATWGSSSLKSRVTCVASCTQCQAHRRRRCRSNGGTPAGKDRLASSARSARQVFMEDKMRNTDSQSSLRTAVRASRQVRGGWKDGAG